MLGKTLFARSLAPSDEEPLLEVDCAGKAFPDLRDFRQGYHGGVIFDEISAATVLSHKKLFQAGDAEISMGSSSTNLFAFKIWTHGLRLVVTTNRWSVEVGELPSVDAQWLRMNAVHVVIRRPLYHTIQAYG